MERKQNKHKQTTILLEILSMSSYILYNVLHFVYMIVIFFKRSVLLVINFVQSIFFAFENILLLFNSVLFGIR